MISIVVFFAAVSACSAGYSGSQGAQHNGVGGAVSGSFAGAGAGTGTGALPQVPNFDFQNFLTSYFDSLRKYHEEFASSNEPKKAVSYSYAYSSPANSVVQAQSSLTRKSRKGRRRFQQPNQNAANGYGFPGGFPAFAGFPQAFGGSFGGPGDGGAVATASIGPDGVRQTAGVFPENPNSPNVDTRFGGGEGGPGSYSVFTSSVSGSSDVDGKKTGFRKAQTTVNDNGKITTYTSTNP